MTLTEKYKDLDFVPGHKEWILLKDVCTEVDKLKEAAKLQALGLQIIEKIFKLHIEKEPTYGPMLEDSE